MQPPDKVSIREAGQEDLAAVLNAYMEAGIGGSASFTVEEALPYFERMKSYPSYRLFVAEADGAIAGVYSLLIMDKLAKRGAPSGVVESVAVLPEWQRHGIGRAMMHHAMEECRAAGCYKLMLSSNLSREQAHQFYDSLGFDRHGYSFAVPLG